MGEVQEGTEDESIVTDLRRSSDDSNAPFYGRREVPRFAIVAPADLMELATGAHTPAQLSEMSRKGCFIEVSKPFTAGESLRIVISREPENFETDGTVIYAREGEGIGVAFRQTAPEQLDILDAWLGANISLCFFNPAEAHAEG